MLDVRREMGVETMNLPGCEGELPAGMTGNRVPLAGAQGVRFHMVETATRERPRAPLAPRPAPQLTSILCLPVPTSRVLSPH
jgi:hypothetical protein